MRRSGLSETRPASRPREHAPDTDIVAHQRSMPERARHYITFDLVLSMAYNASMIERRPATPSGGQTGRVRGAGVRLFDCCHYKVSWHEHNIPETILATFDSPGAGIPTGGNAVDPRITARRRALGVSQARLAHFLGVSRQLIEGAENGRIKLRPIHVERANIVLDILERADQDAQRAVARAS